MIFFYLFPYCSYFHQEGYHHFHQCLFLKEVYLCHFEKISLHKAFETSHTMLPNLLMLGVQGWRTFYISLQQTSCIHFFTIIFHFFHFIKLLEELHSFIGRCSIYEYHSLWWLLHRELENNVDSFLCTNFNTLKICFQYPWLVAWC